MVVNTFGNQKLCVLRPAIGAFGEHDLIVAERLAVSFRSILPVWRTVADMAVEDDESRPALGLTENVESVLDAVGVVGIANAQNVPSITEETRRDVFGESDAGVPLDRDAVVVINPAEVVQTQMPR